MDHNFNACRLTAGLLLTATLSAGCNNDPTRTVVGPSPPSAPPPSITSITPATSSTSGGASMQIAGTGFQIGVVAIFDGTRIGPRFDSRDIRLTTMYLETPPHAAGTVDIVVANPDGQSARYAGGHTYVPPETFDPNGVWSGGPSDGSHRSVGFTIQNGRLLRASAYCAVDVIDLPLPEPISLADGAFSVPGIMSGRIVSAREIVGTMNFRECSDMSWSAGLRTTPSLHP